MVANKYGWEVTEQSSLPSFFHYVGLIEGHKPTLESVEAIVANVFEGQNATYHVADSRKSYGTLSIIVNENGQVGVRFQPVPNAFSPVKTANQIYAMGYIANQFPDLDLSFYTKTSN